MEGGTVPGALDGVNVIDLTEGRAGLAGGQLADHGASVILVEPAPADPHRSMVASAAYDRAKRSIAVDLGHERGREVLERLLGRADVLVEGLGPARADDLGLGYPALHARHPRLVHCSITGYGQAGGAGLDRPGYEPLVLARTGVMAEGQRSGGEPVYPGVPIGSIGAGLLAVIGIMAALVEREDTGLGQHVDTSIFDGTLAFMNMFWEDLEHLPGERGQPDFPVIPVNRRLFVGSFECADGEYLGVHTGANGSHGRLMEAMGLTERVPPAPGNREKAVPLTDAERQIVATEVPRLLASRPRAEWLERLRDHDVCAIPVLRQCEALFEPQARCNDVVVDLDDPELGPVRQVGVAARLARTPGAVRGPAPRVGEHTTEILGELGLDPRTVARYRAEGIVA